MQAFPPADGPTVPGSPRVSVSPLIGRPNPASPGELMLASRLERDEQLAGLFRYNVRVETARGTSPLVDLVWEEGKLVVEVDGFYFHSSAEAFARDRNRDYELAISGYLVLRLPGDEVVADVELAVEKIRDMVAFRRGSGRVARGKGIGDAT
jgi:very-short-patch-repair endonuclease